MTGLRLRTVQYCPVPVQYLYCTDQYEYDLSTFVTLLIYILEENRGRIFSHMPARTPSRVTVLTTEPSSAISCLCSCNNLLAFGCENGVVQLCRLSPDGVPSAATVLYRHSGSVLCGTFSAGSMPWLITGGADGHVHCALTCAKTEQTSRTKIIQQSGSTAGSAGVLVESVAANQKHWAAPVGRFIAVGALPSHDANGSSNEKPSEPAYFGPLTHVIDALQLVSHPDGDLLAAATFGGVSLWLSSTLRDRPTDVADGIGCGSSRSSQNIFERGAALPAARRGTDGTDLACDGWARSLVASCDGHWLASWVMLAGEAPTKLWLWRVADGADFECGGYRAPITDLTWSPDSSKLASCSGDEVLVWSFPQPSADACTHFLRAGPAGRAPDRCKGSDGDRIISAAFNACGALLACGTTDGHVLLFSLKAICGTASKRGTMLKPMLRWAAHSDPNAQLASALSSRAPIEHVAWFEGPPLLVATACEKSSLVGWRVSEDEVLMEQLEGRERDNIGREHVSNKRARQQTSF